MSILDAPPGPPAQAATSLPASPTPRDLCAFLNELYTRQLGHVAGNHYLEHHARPGCVLGQVHTFEWYRDLLPSEGDILDWGCRHAPDSCLLRRVFGQRFRLHGCDIEDVSIFAEFHDFAELRFTRLEHAVRLPYENDAFDAVIGSGVLEHVAQDYESLKEIHRVLKPGGRLIVGYLPNWLSAMEWHRRVIRRRDFHRRRYGLGETSQLLKRAGFYPTAVGYHTSFWERGLSTLGLKRGQAAVARALSWLMPVHVFGGSLRFAATKETCM